MKIDEERKREREREAGDLLPMCSRPTPVNSLVGCPEISLMILLIK